MKTNEQKQKKLRELKESKWDIKVFTLFQNMGFKTCGTSKPKK